MNYSDAENTFKKYKSNILGVISDVSFKIKPGKENKITAGIDFCQLVKSEDANIPFLLQSSDISNREVADKLGAGF